MDGDDNHDDQARSKAMRLGAFQGDAFCRVPKRRPFHPPFIIMLQVVFKNNSEPCFYMCLPTLPSPCGARGWGRHQKNIIEWRTHGQNANKMEGLLVR